MDKNEYIFKRVKEHYNYIKDKYEVVGIFLQGSQNYELDIYEDDYKSDIDTKAIILPTLDDIVYNRQPVSTTLILENNEHIDVKDVRVMFDMFKKQNINFIEILFTKYKIVNPKYKSIMQELFDNNEIIARADINKALNCQSGMSMQKYVALKHPYPTIKNKIDKYGYDPKQLHHILRMNDFIKKYILGKSYKECLIPDNKEYLIQIKKGVLSLDKAETLAKQVNESTHEIAKQNINEDNKPNLEAIEILDNVKYQLIEQYLVESLTSKQIEKDKFEPQNIYFTSDTHFYHKNIIEFENRPFLDVDDMNNKLIEKWNNVVTQNDLVYILGDFSFGNVEDTENILKALNGRKILVKGNHDTFVDNKKFDKSLFEEITECKTISYKHFKLTLCHYPFASNDGKCIQLYGHLHSNRHDSEHYCDTNLLPKNSYNVGVDVNNYMPIHIDSILRDIQK